MTVRSAASSTRARIWSTFSLARAPLRRGLVLQRRPGLHPGRAEVLGDDGQRPRDSAIWGMEMPTVNIGVAPDAAGNRSPAGRSWVATGASGGECRVTRRAVTGRTPPRPGRSHEERRNPVAGEALRPSTSPRKPRVRTSRWRRRRAVPTGRWRSGWRRPGMASASRATRSVVGVSRGSDWRLRVARSDRPTAPLTAAAPKKTDKKKQKIATARACEPKTNTWRSQRGNASTDLSRKSARSESKNRSSSRVRFPRVFSGQQRQGGPAPPGPRRRP